MDPLNWDGPTFLTLYLLWEFTAIAAAHFYRDHVRDIKLSTDMPKFSPYELAYLAGGIPAMCEAATVKLMHAGCLQANHAMRRLTRTDVPPMGLDEVERAVFESADSEAESKSRATGTRAITRSQQYVVAQAKLIRQRLQALHLMIGDAELSKMQLITFVVVASPMLLGVPKVFVGIARDKPVGFLITLLIINSLVAIISTFVIPVARTKLGDSVLNNMRHRMETLKYSASKGANLPPQDLAMGVALFGVSTLAAYSTVDSWHRLKRIAVSGNGSSCSSGSCGGGSCGGGGCGGGCGGCGG